MSHYVVEEPTQIFAWVVETSFPEAYTLYA